MQKSVMLMCSFVLEMMQYGCLFFVGDVVYIVLLIGVKGMNFVVVDVCVLFCVFGVCYWMGDVMLFECYLVICFECVWCVEYFLYFMMNMLYVLLDDLLFVNCLKFVELKYVMCLWVVVQLFVENYVGLLFDDVMVFEVICFDNVLCVIL